MAGEKTTQNPKQMKTKGLNKIEILKVDETEDPEKQGISEEWGIW